MPAFEKFDFIALNAVLSGVKDIREAIGVALGPAGALFVSDFATDTISEVAADGTRSEFASLAQPN